MKRFRVIIPPIVQELIRAQVMFIARDSIDHALAWEDRLRAAMKGLTALPARNAIDHAASERVGQPIRKLVFDKTYLVFYRIRETDAAVDILNFRHGARLPQPKDVTARDGASLTLGTAELARHFRHKPSRLIQ